MISGIETKLQIRSRAGSAPADPAARAIPAAQTATKSSDRARPPSSPPLEIEYPAATQRQDSRSPHAFGPRLCIHPTVATPIPKLRDSDIAGSQEVAAAARQQSELRRRPACPGAQPGSESSYRPSPTFLPIAFEPNYLTERWGSSPPSRRPVALPPRKRSQGLTFRR
jgi:hypothetical protein